MKIQTVQEYNAEDMWKWRERVEEWKNEDSNNIIPQVMMVGFRNPDGELKKQGFVASGERCAYWAKTKTEAIARYKRNQEKD